MLSAQTLNVISDSANDDKTVVDEIVRIVAAGSVWMRQHVRLMKGDDFLYFVILTTLWATCGEGIRG